MESTSDQQITYTYKLIKGADDELYVSVGPLMLDIEKSIDKLMTMDVTSLNNENKQIFELKILGLKTVYEFLGALQMEQKLKDKSKELKGKVELNVSENNFKVPESSIRTIH